MAEKKGRPRASKRATKPKSSAAKEVKATKKPKTKLAVAKKTVRAQVGKVLTKALHAFRRARGLGRSSGDGSTRGGGPKATHK